MRRITSAFTRRTVAALFGVSLGVGAATVFAEPAQCSTGEVCSPYSCSSSCRKRGYEGGDCVNGVCVCWQT